jgi:hypothetical protein
LREDWALSKKVEAWLGVTKWALVTGHQSAGGEAIPVLMLLKARPRSPSPAPEANEDETWVASSMTWPLTEVPPTVTSSVPMLPLAPDPSAYWMLQLPDACWKLELLEES